MSKLNQYLNLIMFLAITTGALYTAYSMGCNAKIDPVSDHVKITNGIDVLKVRIDCSYHVQQISDEFGVSYYIYITSTDGDMVIECLDQEVNGETVTAEEYKNMFLLQMGDL